MKKVMGFFGMVCISMLFLISLASCHDSSDKKLSLEIYKPYYETTKWCTCTISITNGSGNYEYSISDKEGLEFLSEEDGKFITFKGLKEGIYKVKVIDKATNENAVVTIKVLPQAIEIDALMRKVDDPLFSKGTRLFLMGDAENKCFILPHAIQGTNPSEPIIFDGYYELVENEGVVTGIILYDKNKNIVRNYQVETSEEILDCLSKLLYRQPWDRENPFFGDHLVRLKSGEYVVNATAHLASTFIPYHFYN